MDDRYLMCLCPRCRQYFQDAGGYRLRRARFPQETKEICTYCQTQYGYDYYVVSANTDDAE